MAIGTTVPNDKSTVKHVKRNDSHDLDDEEDDMS